VPGSGSYTLSDVPTSGSPTGAGEVDTTRLDAGLSGPRATEGPWCTLSAIPRYSAPEGLQLIVCARY
jgi:hypothetical protein